MQHRIEDDTNSEDGVRNAQTMARNVEDKFQDLKDDVDLLKAEIRSTLVDLRESMTKEHTVSPQPQIIVQEAGTQKGSSTDSGYTMPSAAPGMNAAPASSKRGGPENQASDGQVRESMDTVKMGNIIWWLGMVKGRGLTEQQIRPFLEAYEESGHLKSAMARFTYRSLVHLETVDESIPEQTFTAEQYSDCLLQLHNIICTPGYTVVEAINVPIKKAKAITESPAKSKTKKPSRPKKVTNITPLRHTPAPSNFGQNFD